MIELITNMAKIADKKLKIFGIFRNKTPSILKLQKNGETKKFAPE